MTVRSNQSQNLIAQLGRADPVGSMPLAIPELDAALDAISQAVVRQPRAARGRLSTSRARVALVVAAGLLLLAGVATAAVALHAHTGLFPSGPNAAVGGPGEELDPAAPDFDAVALKLSAGIPYPAGYASWRDWVLTVNFSKSNEPDDGGTYPAGLVSTGALRGWFAASAFCAWVRDWHHASVAGDRAEAARAEQTISAAPSWPAVTAEDPHPDPTSANDAGAETGTLFGWFLPYGNAIAAGDRARVEQLLASGYGQGNCWLADPAWMKESRAHPDWSTLSAPQLARRYERFLAEQGS